MKYKYDLGKEQFDALLTILSPDADEAGTKYERIRAGLVRFFRFNGCAEPEELADETINRVAARSGAFDPARNIDPASFFRGFASNILKEYRRSVISARELSDGTIAAAEKPDDPGEAEKACLDRCLEELPANERHTIVEYFSRERQEKIDMRQKMCERLKCSPAALYTRVHRIKAALRGCIEGCVNSEM